MARTTHVTDARAPPTELLVIGAPRRMTTGHLHGARLAVELDTHVRIRFAIRIESLVGVIKEVAASARQSTARSDPIPGIAAAAAFLLLFAGPLLQIGGEAKPQRERLSHLQQGVATGQRGREDLAWR
jgi:hypothetical protein